MDVSDYRTIEKREATVTPSTVVVTVYTPGVRAAEPVYQLSVAVDRVACDPLPGDRAGRLATGLDSGKLHQRRPLKLTDVGHRRAAAGPERSVRRRGG